MNQLMNDNSVCKAVPGFFQGCLTPIKGWELFGLKALRRRQAKTVDDSVSSYQIYHVAQPYGILSFKYTNIVS